MDPQFSPSTIYSTPSYVQNDTLCPEIRNEQRVQQSSEDQGLSENPLYQQRTFSAPKKLLCPVPSCSRNLCTPRKTARTDNLRIHLKKVHSLPITKGIRLLKWIAENQGALENAENRAQASLSLRY